MTYNVFGGTLSLTQSINQSVQLIDDWCPKVFIETIVQEPAQDTIFYQKLS